MLPAANARARTTTRYRIVNLHSRPSWCSLRLVAPVGKWILGARQGRTRPPHRTGGRAEPRRRCAVPSCSATARVRARIRARHVDHAVVNCRTRVCYEALCGRPFTVRREVACSAGPLAVEAEPSEQMRGAGVIRSQSVRKAASAGQAASLAPGAHVGWSACSDPPRSQCKPNSSLLTQRASVRVGLSRRTSRSTAAEAVASAIGRVAGISRPRRVGHRRPFT
jgi:hypothetical protein